MRFVGAASRGEGRGPCGCGARLSPGRGEFLLAKPATRAFFARQRPAPPARPLRGLKRNQKKGAKPICSSRNVEARGRSAAYALADNTVCCEAGSEIVATESRTQRHKDDRGFRVLARSSARIGSWISLLEPGGESCAARWSKNGQERPSQQIANRIGAFLLLPFLWPDKEKEVAAPGRNPGAAQTRSTPLTTRQRHESKNGCGART